MIVFEKVSKKFFNDTYGVKEVSFAVETGELVLVTGPTGSGKTTLMRLITKEYLPTTGTIIFNETDLADIKPKALPLHRRQIGVIFQDYRLLPEANVWENIALPLFITGYTEEKIEERVTDLLKLVHLEDKAELFPKELSGGEAQRVSIARALATAPKLIFADEPTGNLDVETTRNIIKLLKKINELGTTVLLATHDLVVLNELKDARKIELNAGELLTTDDGKKKKLKIKKTTPPPEKTKIKETEDKENKKEASEKKEKEEETKKTNKNNVGEKVLKKKIRLSTDEESEKSPDNKKTLPTALKDKFRKIVMPNPFKKISLKRKNKAQK